MTRPGVDLTPPLADPAFYAGDPHPLFARLRAEAPLAWNEELGFWAVSTHADVMAMSRDPETFCSGEGVLLMDLGREMPDVPGAILYVDPPEHSRYRRLIQPAFAPSRIRAMEEPIRQRARTLLDSIQPGSSTDIVSALAVPFPLLVIADMLGVSGEEWPRFYEWSDAAIAAGTEQTDETMNALTEMADYFMTVITEKKRAPADDLVSTLVTVEVDGELLDDDELLMFLIQLLVAGNETTRNLVSGGLVALGEHPAEWARLVADPRLVPSAVEELLRWTTPVISFMRTATRDVVYRDQTIGEGEAVLLLYASANRDEEAFGSDAGVLDLAREPNHQIAFGFGEHYCLGAALARLEGRVILEEILARFSSLKLVGEVHRLESAGVVAGVLDAEMILA